MKFNFIKSPLSDTEFSQPQLAKLCGLLLSSCFSNFVSKLSRYTTSSFELLFFDCEKVFNKFPRIVCESDNGEASRFKIKHTESITNAEGNTKSGDNSKDANNSHNDGNQTTLTTEA